MCILNLRRGDESRAGRRQKQLWHGIRPTSQAAAASLKVKHVHSTPPRRHSAKGFNPKFQTRFLSFLAASSVWPSVYLSGSALGVAPRYTPSPPPTPPLPCPVWIADGIVSRPSQRLKGNGKAKGRSHKHAEEFALLIRLILSQTTLSFFPLSSPLL